jgi:hypothetical protein
MALPRSISILTRKRDNIRDTIAAYEAKLKQAQADLAHVNATLRLFAASGEPEDFPPYVDLNRVFRRGETTQFCIETLRKEGPLDTRQLATRLMKHKGLDTSDKVLVTTVSLRIVQSLRMRARRGQELDGTERRRGVCLWRLIDSEFRPASVGQDR